MRTAAAAAAFLTLSALAAAEPTIASVRVAGLRRTTEGTALELLERFVGKPASEAAPEAVAAVLVGTGIFENVRSAAVPEADGATARLEVAVDEKLARIAAPVFYIDDGGASGGAAYIDSNAFGRADSLVAAALLLSDGWLTSAAYVDNRAGKRVRKNSFSVFVSDTEREDQDERGDTLRRYRALSAGVSAASTVALFPFLDAEASLSFRDVAVENGDDPAAVPDASTRVLSARAGFAVEGNAWNGTFLSERSLRAGAAYAYAFVGNPYYELDAKAAAELPFGGELGNVLRLRFRAAGAYAPDAPAAADQNPSGLGIALLPSDFAARSLAGASLGLEAKLARLPFGVISGTAAYEAAVAEGPLIGEVGAHGPAGGVRLYVAKVAIPAMDLTVAYNLETGLAEVRFGIGMRY